MRSILKVAALAGIFAALACAETWNGRLLDASCVDQQKSAACDPSSATVTFAINVSGKIYKLDDAGNAKAVEAIKARGQSAKEPKEPEAKEPASPGAAATITAKVTGTLEGEVVKVESIQVQ
jgi:hypothetical protein